MTEQERVLRELGDASIISALEWAARSAHTRAFLDFDPDTGHDRTVLGTTAHALLRNRLDRIFRCEDYLQGEAGDDAAAEAADIILKGLGDRDQKEMPRNVRGPVVRDNLNGSPGWRYGNYQWFLASHDYGDVWQIQWGRKSPTKISIAARMGPNDPNQLVARYDEPVNFTDFQTIAEEFAKAAEEGILQLVLAHAIDPMTGMTELSLGRPRLNTKGGSPWTWLASLGGRGDEGTGKRVQGPAPRPQDPDSVADAPVRLRPNVAEKRPIRDIKGL